MKARIEKEIAEPDIREKVLQGLRKASSAIGREVSKGELKIGKRSSKTEVKKGNIISGKRKRGSKKLSAVESKKGKVNTSKLSSKDVMCASAGDLVSCSPTLFDGEIPGSWSKENPQRCLGVVTKRWKQGKLLQVRWRGGDELSKVLHTDIRVERKKSNASAILAVLLVEGQVAKFEAADKSKWPKDFFEALVKSD
jgi:hypothetical protein